MLHSFSPSPSSVPLSGTSWVIFSANTASGVKSGKTYAVPFTVTSPSATAEPSATSTATVTVTETAQPSPSSEPAMVKLDGGQYLGLTMGLVLALVFLSALLVAQMRRP
jgi:hypothetical protein